MHSFRLTTLCLGLIAGLGLLVSLPLGGLAQTPEGARCMPLPRSVAMTLDSAWAAYRQSAMEAADSAFRRVLSQCEREAGALAGRAYVAMRRGDLNAAKAFLVASVASLPGGYDGLSGLGMVAYRQGDTNLARESFTRALGSVPGDSVSLWYLSRLPEQAARVKLAPVRRPAVTRVDARVGSRVFQVPDGRHGWRPMWIKGVNIGAALPGKHPSEFPPDDGTYDQWLELVASMGSNTIRVYTIHPPHFYRALERWNLAHPAAPIWLIHGVWTELPPGEQEEQYDDPAWLGEFRGETRRVVDLLHGHAVIDPRPGHSAGGYTADVSRWVLAYIIGREWEPYSVVAYSRQNPGQRTFHGRFLTVARGNATEVWLAEQCDYLLGYEMDGYNTQRPIAYTNWPTLDPLHHPTESTKEEEDRFRSWPLPEESHEFDNDAVGLDAVKMRALPSYKAGVFASYHAYPYYPDFMVLDPGYAKARSPEGPSSYYGYLRELVEHHGMMPVVVSEYGVPSSRGNAHVQPQGWNHGGHSEAAQAEIDARLTRDIYAAGGAGAVLFAVIDEWFKKNWIVIDFENPLERNRLWLNPLDAEQHYGIIAMRPGRKDSAIRIDGDPTDWGARGVWWTSPNVATAGDPLAIRGFRVTSDEAYVYLRLDVGAIDWARGRYLVGIDTYRSDLGGRQLPRTGARCGVGLEFALDLTGPASSMLLVDRPYDLYRTVPIEGATPPQTMQVYNRPWAGVAHDDARWDTLLVETNRARIGRDGTPYPAQRYERNRLLYARQSETTLADWFADPATGTIEVRLAWGMLHVLDPSSRTVLGGADKGGGPEGVRTEGFHFVLQSYAPGAESKAPRPIGCDAPGTSGGPALWTWPTWEVPNWYPETKPLFESMRRTFNAITPRVAAPNP